LTLLDVSDDQALLVKLNSKLLNDACELFGVRREWLDCASDQPHDTHHFYKNTAGYASLLNQLIEGDLGVLVS